MNKKKKENSETVLLFKSNNNDPNDNLNIANRQLFIEKYKPKTVNNLILDSYQMVKLNNLIKNNVIPNLLLCGPSGSGKTITLNLLIKEVMSKFSNNYKDSVMEINVSDNRGLEIINNSLIYFCKKKTDCNKIIILDEADNITKKAQNLLNNLMEEYNDTRFCFTCNESSKIIETIQSRCLIFRFKSISDENMYSRLEHICKNENIKYTEDGLNSIIHISQGDLRYAINNLEAIYSSFGQVTKDNTYKLCYQPHPEEMIHIIKLSLKMDIKKIVTKLLQLKKDGYCNSDLLQSLITILRNININETIRLAYIRYLNECYININDGNDSNLQLFSCFSKIIKWLRSYQISSHDNLSSKNKSSEVSI